MYIVFSIVLVFCLIIPTNFAIAQESGQSRKEFLRQEIQQANAFISDTAIRRYKYEKMKESPLAFYRGTAHLYYRDLAQGVIAIPELWKNTPRIKTWLAGDLHLQNVGFFDVRDKIIFGLNDLDEADLGPFYWDLLRLSTCIFLLAEEVGFSLSPSEARNLAQGFFAEYQKTLEALHGNQEELTRVLTKGYLSGFTRRTLEEIEETKSHKKLLKKWTIKLGAGMRVFDFTNEELAKPDHHDLADLQGHWSTYLKDLDSFYLLNPGYFAVKDRAVRLQSGLGSLGVKKYYVLVEGSSEGADDDVILEVKEQRSPSMEFASEAPESVLWANQGQRVKAAHQAMLARNDSALGVLAGQRAYLVRRISPWKHSFEGAEFTRQEDLANCLQYTAQTIGLAHSRADEDVNPALIPYSFEQYALAAIKQWPATKTILGELAERYAHQVKADHLLFQELLQAGELP